MKLEIDMEKIKTLIYLLECMEICFRETADREQDLISVLHDEHWHPDRDWTEQIKKMNEEIIRLYQKEPVYESMKIMQETAEYTAKIKQELEAYITPTEPIYTYRDIR